MFNPSQDIPSLYGKVIIVTGGNSGIGYKTVLELAAKGAHVYMGSRREERATAAIKKLELELAQRGIKLGEGNAGRVTFFPCDLATIAKARAAADVFLSKESRLDVLVNNAGSLELPYEINEDGVSTMLASNHIGPYAFTERLLPILTETAKNPGSDVRIVTVASIIQKLVLPKSGIKFDTIDDLNVTLGDDGFQAQQRRYALSKLANILYTSELQRRLDEQNIPIIAVSLHPGVVTSEGVQTMKSNQSLLVRTLLGILSALASVDTTKGSLTSLYAAASPQVKAAPATYKGKFLLPYGKVGQATPQSHDPKLAKDLWKVTEEVVRKKDKGSNGASA